MDQQSAIADRRAFFAAANDTKKGPEQPPAHDYDLLLTPREGYLYALIRTVVLTPDMYRQAFLRVGKAIDDSLVKRLMFEYEMPFALPGERTYEFLHDLAEIRPGMRIAAVARHQMHLLTIDVAGHVARDTGCDFRFFPTPAEAEKWLLEE